MKNILIQIKNSIYNKEYYKLTVLTETFKNSVKYLSRLSLMISLVTVIVFTCFTPHVIKNIKNSFSPIVSSYPEDLNISIKDGKAYVNKSEPYYIKMPISITNVSEPKDVKFENMLVINTTEPFNLDKFKEYSTVAVLTQNEIVSVSDSGEMKIVPLSKFKNIEITKSWIQDKQDLVYKFIPWVFVLLIILAFGGIFVFEIISGLFLTLLYAFIALGILKLKGIDLSYKKSYQVTLHAITLVLIIGAIGNFIKPINNIFIKVVLFIIIMYWNFGNTKIEKIENEVKEVGKDKLVKTEDIQDN